MILFHYLFSMPKTVYGYTWFELGLTGFFFMLYLAWKFNH